MADYSNGIVTAPVDLPSVSSLIGAGSYDLGAVCKSTTINKWSIHKPVIAVGKLFDDDFSCYEGGYLSGTDRDSSWFLGTNCYGLVKSVIEIPCSMVETLDEGVVLTGYNSIAISSDVTYAHPRGNTVTPIEPYRLSDFVGYYHQGVYPLTNVSLPYEVFNLIVNSPNIVQASVCLRYHYEDVIKQILTVNEHTVNAGLLGMKSIFNAEKGGMNDGLRLCIIASAPSSSMKTVTGKDTNRATPLSILSISNTKLGSYDSKTDSGFMLMADTGNMEGLIGGTKTSPLEKQFYDKEEVFAKAAIAKKVKVNGTEYWYLFGIGEGQWFTISTGSSGKTWLTPSSVTVKVTIRYDSANYQYIAYINAESDFNLTVSGMGRLLQMMPLSFFPYGGKETIQSIGDGYYCNTKDDDGNYYRDFGTTGTHTLTSSSITGWSASTTPATRKPFCIFKSSQDNVVLSATTKVRTSDSSEQVFTGKSESVTLPTGSNTVTAEITLS